MRGVCWLTIALFALAAGASAQEFDFDRDRQPAVSLDGLWRFHTGDDPNWAKPGFDDSQWSLLRSDKSWDQQGYEGYSGIAWYRFRVRGVRKGPLAVYFSPKLSSYQVFANGRWIGSYGEFGPHGVWYGPQGVVFEIPADDASADIAIAIRVWHDAKIGLGGGATEDG